MDDDLNTPLALAAVHEFITEINRSMSETGFDAENVKEIKEFIKSIDSVLGLLEHKKEEAPEEVKRLVHEREVARKVKNFKKSDELREEIRKLGWEIQDTGEGQKLSKKI
jgi:cysteinyl-tRNA synthetase